MDKKKLRTLLESDIKEVKFTLNEFISMMEDDDYSWASNNLMEEALERIANGESDPQKIARETLSKVQGDVEWDYDKYNDKIKKERGIGEYYIKD